MIKKALFLVLLVFCTLSSRAQLIRYSLPKPPQWGVEKFNFPIDFAPKIPFIGVEELRFAPGWSNSKSSQYWAYDFIWFIEGKPRLNKDTLNNYMVQYYNGLYISNFKNKTVTPPANFSASELRSVPPLLNDQETYEGEIKTLDFLTGQPITFNARVRVKNLPQIGHSVILIEISPEGYKAPVWVDLNNIVNGFAVNVNNEN